MIRRMAVGPRVESDNPSGQYSVSWPVNKSNYPVLGTIDSLSRTKNCSFRHLIRLPDSVLSKVYNQVLTSYNHPKTNEKSDELPQETFGTQVRCMGESVATVDFITTSLVCMTSDNAGTKLSYGAT